MGTSHLQALQMGPWGPLEPVVTSPNSRILLLPQKSARPKARLLGEAFGSVWALGRIATRNSQGLAVISRTHPVAPRVEAGLYKPHLGSLLPVMAIGRVKYFLWFLLPLQKSCSSRCRDSREGPPGLLGICSPVSVGGAG